MNYYEAEQLTRQRHDQFATEARGARLLANSRQPVPSDQARGAQAPTINLGAVLNRSAKTILAGVSWLTSRSPRRA
jgi:hypothetical protein